MNKTVVHVLAWIGVGVIAGLLYWVGHFNGYNTGADKFHKWCKETSIVTFAGDDVGYICSPPPTLDYEYHMDFPTTTVEYDLI